MPPAGGYQPIQYKRNLPVRGFRPVYYLVGMHLIMAYGFYKVFLGIREQKRRKTATRSADTWRTKRGRST
ncbi:predicted protein [Histoplasma mississippiense (nom. inval.)]|uniref:predicted protein n=1 Tax=Ajellomyces capsulatus (strain NAm1 / WU24) TaxID=2059318 RepID=UPI000157C255|nr:predicted protein [Histoplasma mississippiense (nom. inval.)]EDN07849.1 predicted protein [Histoplasma mississippiense (nom. inval.)]